MSMETKPEAVQPTMLRTSNRTKGARQVHQCNLVYRYRVMKPKRTVLDNILMTFRMMVEAPLTMVTKAENANLGRRQSSEQESAR